MRLSSPIGINQSLPVGRMRTDRSAICLSCVLLFAILSFISASDKKSIGTRAITETIDTEDSSFPSDRANPSDDTGSVQSLQTSTEETTLPTATTILDDTNTPNNELEWSDKMPDARGLSVSDINDIIWENIKEKDASEAIKLPKRQTIGWLLDEFPGTPFCLLQSCSCDEEALDFRHQYGSGVITHEIFCETNKLLHYFVDAGKNLKSEFLPLLPLPFNIVEGEVQNVFSLRNSQLGESLQVFLEDADNLPLLFDSLKNSIPLSGIQETLTALRIAIKKFVSHVGGFITDLGPHDGTSVDMDILGKLGEVTSVAKEILSEMFSEYSPGFLERGFNLLSEVASMVTKIEKLSIPEYFHRFVILLKKFADTVRGCYCGFYASGFPQSVGFAPSFIGKYFLNTCKAPVAENGKEPSSWVPFLPDIPGITGMGQKANGQNECPIVPDLPPPDSSSVNAGMQSSTPQSIIARLEAFVKHPQYRRSHDYLVSNVRNGVTNTFPFQPKWSANNAEPSSLGSSLTNNPTFNQPFSLLKLLSAPLQQAVPPPLPIITDKSPFNHGPNALPPYRNSAADKYDQLLPGAPATETYDDPTEFTYSPPSKATENSQDEGNSDASIPWLPPLPLFSGGGSVENGFSIDGIDTPQSESFPRETNPLGSIASSDITPYNASTLPIAQPILQSPSLAPQVASFHRDFSARASETPLEEEASQPSYHLTNLFLNFPRKIASLYKHLYPHLQRLQYGNSGPALSPNTAEKKLANPCGTVASLPSVSNFNNALNSDAGLQFPLQFTRNEISSALGNVALTPGDAVIIIPTNGLVLMGRVVDTVSQISFDVYRLRSMSPSSQGSAEIWHFRSRDMGNPICRQQLQSLSQS